MPHRLRRLAPGIGALALSCSPHSSGGHDCDQDHDETWVLTANSSEPSSMHALDGRLFFQAYGPDGDPAVWTHDGEGEPKRVAALLDAELRPSRGAAIWNGRYYFPGRQDGDTELGRTDGEDFEVIEIRPGPAPSDPDHLTVFQDELYFVADDGVLGRELWKVDSDDVVSLVADLEAGGGDSSFSALVVAEDRLLFSVTGQGLWEHDGRAPQLISANLQLLSGLALDGTTYLILRDTGLGTVGIYTYDGVNPPARKLSVSASWMRVFEDRLLFVTREDPEQILWSWDGKADPEAVLQSEPYEAIEFLAVLDDALYVATGGMIWRYDGDAPPASVTEWSGPAGHVRVGELEGVLYHGGVDQRGFELWAFDGEDSERVADLYPGRSCQPEDSGW